MNTPCPSCPWRKSSRVGGFDIPRFQLCKMQNLRDTVGDGDAFRTIMACHYSLPGDETPCIGYVHVEGYSNLSVRLMVIEGKLDFRAIDEACKDIELWPSFDDMLAAYERARVEQ